MQKFTQQLQEQFARMCSTGKLFRVSLPGSRVWEYYLNSFTPENNPIFRDPASTQKNCNHCHNFIRRYGNIVAIDENFNLMTIFDVKAEAEYEATTTILSAAIRGTKVAEVFFETFEELNSLPYESTSKKNLVFQLGTANNPKRYTREESEKYGVVKPEELRTFHHMFLSLPKEYVDMSGVSVESLMGSYRDAKNVFQRAMETISLDTLQLVKDLILQGSLLDGQTHLYKIEQIIPLKKEYDSLPASHRDNWCWIKSYKLPYAKFKNELIGVLCSELSEGEELNKASQSWNKRVDPVNYMKTTAPITKKQIEEAKKFVEDEGYTESFNRRFANIDDIKASEILHVNAGDGKLKTVSIFDGVKSTSTRHKRSEFDGIEEVGIEKFMKDILPGCTSIEAFLANNQEGNLVSLTTANQPNSKPIFKWPNNYSWTFNGNLAGKSQLKDAVASHGGKIDGVLRFSIGWAEGDPSDNSDLDAHAQEPDKTHIYFGSYRGTGKRTLMSGNLDVDITQPNSQCNNKNVAENIVWDNLKKMKPGVYKLWVHQFIDRGSKGFTAEVEFNGEIYTYEYKRKVAGSIAVAEVTLDKSGNFTIKHILPETGVSSREIYGLETNQFHKVNLVCLSPNHWDGNKVGNLHYFLMLEGCKSPVSIRSFHNENLLPELAAHRKVLEVLATTNMIEPAKKQLSGLGFNATVRDEVILRLQGSHKRVVRVKF